MVFFLLLLLLICGNAESSVCGCCTPCVQVQQQCPPPVVCLPPPPPCICPRPPRIPCLPVCPPLIPPPVIENTCCVLCAHPCALSRKRRDISKEEFLLALNNTVNDPICNHMELKHIMEANMDMNSLTSRKRIKEVAEAKLRDKIAVACARGEFSYSAYTESFCQVRKGDLTCYAFKMSF